MSKNISLNKPLKVATAFSGGLAAVEFALRYEEIEGYEGKYSITNDGRVWSYPKNGTGKNGKFLKPGKNKDGYLIVGLSNNGKRKYFQIHRLVANTFIKNKYKKLQVNHIDGNKQNNISTNLEWVTQSENINHALKLGLKPKRHNKKKGKKYIGVTYKKSTMKYAATIQHNGVRFNLGYFNTDLEAAQAYNKKAQSLGIKEFLND